MLNGYPRTETGLRLALASGSAEKNISIVLDTDTDGERMVIWFR